MYNIIFPNKGIAIRTTNVKGGDGNILFITQCIREANFYNNSWAEL